MLERSLFHLLPYLNIRKIFNVLLGWVSLLLSRIIKRPIIWGRPYTLNLESTNLCNLKCVECPTGMGILSRPTGSLSFESFKLYFDQLKDHLIYVTLYFQGEPFLNKNILRMADYAEQHRVYSMLSTNGHFFRTDDDCRRILESGLGSIILSLDGLSSETYKKYRQGGNFNVVKEGIIRLSRLRKEMKQKSPRLYLQLLVLKHNEHEINRINEFGKEIGADRVLLKSAQVYDFDGIETILPKAEKYRRYEKQSDGIWTLRGSYRNTCRLLWTNTLVTWDGRVVPCCFDKNSDHQFGDLTKEEFDSIWKNIAYQKFRQTILKNRKSIPICTNCTEGLNVLL